MNKIIALAYLFITLSGITQPLDTSKLLSLKAPARYQVQVNTSIGNMIIEVNKEVAPLAADRFYQLVSSGFFNNSRLFRSNAKYLQFGIGNDSATNSFWERHPIADEPVIQKNTAALILATLLFTLIKLIIQN
jgi:peptidyl-prolyl cis-trans isomerase A (cyclophilin A)